MIKVYYLKVLVFVIAICLASTAVGSATSPYSSDFDLRNMIGSSDNTINSENIVAFIQEKYPSSPMLNEADIGNCFISAGQGNNVNPAFLIATACLEGGFGTAGWATSHPECHNTFGYGIPSGTTQPDDVNCMDSWCAMVQRVASVIAHGTNYYTQGLYTVSQVRAKYATSPNAASIVSLMNELYTFSTNSNHASSSEMPTWVLSPVDGPISINRCSSCLSTCNTCTNGNGWCFHQHKCCCKDKNCDDPCDGTCESGKKVYGHGPNGGIRCADDTYAWDVNLMGKDDCGLLVYAAFSGKVIEAGGDSGQVIIEHDYNGKKWWSAYLHMTDISVSKNDNVSQNDKLGKISNKAVIDVPCHLHFAVYTGSNTEGGLKSFDIEIRQRGDNLPVTPNAPTINSPGSSSGPGDSVSSLSPIFTWESVSNADFYAIYISKYPYGEENLVFDSIKDLIDRSITGTSFELPISLQEGMKYRWNMKAHSTTGWSGISNTLYFQTPTSGQNTEVIPVLGGTQQDTQITLTLDVHDGSVSGPIIPGAQVTGHDGSGNNFQQTTDSNGYVTIEGNSGTWSFSASANGYETNNWDQEITDTCAKHAFLQKEGTKQEPVHETLPPAPVISPQPHQQPAPQSVNDITGYWILNYVYHGEIGSHKMIIDTFNPNTGDFKGHGWYLGDPSYEWDITGAVNGNDITFHISYTGLNPTFSIDAMGAISSTSFMSGNAKDPDQSTTTWNAAKASNIDRPNWDITGRWMLNYQTDRIYTHKMIIETFNPNTGDFKGRGQYLDDPAIIWDISGTVDGNDISWHIAYTGLNPTFWADAVGVISSDTFMSGKANDPSRSATWNATRT